jgi:naphthoate synthase
MSPTAIRFLKSAFLVATDGLAGLQEFAGNATGLYYTTDEAQEGSQAFLEHRPPDFSRFPRRP